MKNHKTALELNRPKLLEQGILSEENINFYSDIFDFQFKTAARWSENLPALDITAGTAEPLLKPTLIVSAEGFNMVNMLLITVIMI